METKLKPKTRPKLIIDTDPGHDDALAILFLEKSQRYDILALTTVAGNTSIENTTNNARFILDLLGSPTAIFSGADRPLKRDLIRAVVHGESGLAGAKIVKTEPLTSNASQKISELVRANPNEVTIILLGPQTNLAQAFVDDPELPTLIKEVVIMGGAIHVPGNKNRVGEFNVFVDPDAADIVMQAPVKKVLVPLDACNDIYLTLEDFKRLQTSSLFEPLEGMMSHFIEGIKQFENFSGALVYDALAAYYLINPTAFMTIPMDIKIETTSDLTRGMTVADRRSWGEKNYNVDVVTNIDRPVFVEDFFSILGR